MFKIIEISDNNILTVTPNWIFSSFSGNKITLQDIGNISYSDEFINRRLKLLILDKFVQLKLDKTSDCIINDMMKCKVYLNEVNILKYLI